jgi:disulfide bond formation protein DsbB
MFYRVRVKLCNTGIVMLVVVCILGLIACYYPRVFPLFILALVIWLVTIIPAFYVEFVDKTVNR